ncbi:hypothetical protein ACJ8S7_005077 [Klebsiella pneumoniae]|nr:hypothetical protein [Klebsiella pneumoniae]
MAGLLDAMMQGYTQKVLGSDSTAAKGQAAAQTADAYQRLQQAIGNDYALQKQQFESDPANKGKTWQAPSTQERFNDQVQAMIYSGDPNLQARGLQLLDQPKADETTNLEKTAKLLGLDPMQVFMMMHPGPSQTRVNVNIPKQDQPMSFEDAQKLDWSNVPGGYQPGMSMMDAGRAGARLAATKDQAETTGATTVMDSSLTGMENNPQITQKPVPAAVSELRSQPGIIGQIANTALNVAGIPQNPADVKFIADRNMYVGQLTKAMNGAGASDQERENWLRQAPQLTDSPQQRQIKLRALREATDQFNLIAKNKGGNVVKSPGAPKAPQAPVATKRYNPATGKLEVIK